MPNYAFCAVLRAWRGSVITWEHGGLMFVEVGFMDVLELESNFWSVD